VRLPGTSLAWKVAPGSTLRLQELLARLGYLPVRWRAAAGSPSTPAAEVAAAVRAPEGTFSWRYPQTPVSLRNLWKPGSWNVVTQGAVMRFEDEHGLATDGVAGPQVWRRLLRDDLAGRRSDAGYSYVLVRETLPQSLTLWHSGHVILTSPGNTGIPQSPTAPGTWPVFEHIPVGTMSGTNPDGTHYHDPGIRWISYFHGGDALHEFPRPSYGTPQSLGCVELPEAAAARVWPYTPIGTLVTIES
jgi:lipoprotein-anchoring transpeptidase ErfK/SrfK